MLHFSKMCPYDCISVNCLHPNPKCKACCTGPNTEPPKWQTPPPPPPPAVALRAPPSHHNHSKRPIFVTSLVVILATGFLFFTCYTIYRFTSYWIASRRRRRSSRREPDGDDGPDEFLAEEHGPVVDHPIWYIRTVGLDPSAIAAITVVKYKRGEGLIDGTDCSVCLSEFQDDEALRLLPKCSHAFHIPCIDTWLRSHTNCPLCRARIVVDTTAVVPAPAAAAVQNPGLVEEINQETVIDSETSDDEASGIQSRAEVAVKIDNECGLNDGVQPVRRSVSMDSMSAAMISAAVAGAIQGQRNNDKQLSGEKEAPSTITGRVKERNGGINQGLLRLIGSPSIDRSMQSGPSAVKRSLSCSAKVFLQRHGSRNRGSILPQ